MGKQIEREVTKIVNSQLGEMMVHEDSIIHFPDGIMGYEYLKHFALVELEETEPFLWMVALEEQEISLPLLRYKSVSPEYKLTLSSTERKKMKLGQNDEFHLFFIITVHEAKKNITANLKGPIVVNFDEGFGAQVIAINDEYKINHPIGSPDENPNE